MNVEEAIVKRKETTEGDPFSDAKVNIASSPDFMNLDPLEVVRDPVYKEGAECRIYNDQRRFLRRKDQRKLRK